MVNTPKNDSVASILGEAVQDFVQRELDTDPDFQKHMDIEKITFDIDEELYARMRQFNWGYKSLSKRLGITRKECKKLMKKEEKTVREVAQLAVALELNLKVIK